MTNLVIQVWVFLFFFFTAANKIIIKTSLLNISVNLHICRNKVSMRRSIKAIENQVEISRLKSGFAQKGMGGNGHMQGYRWFNTRAVQTMYVV